MKKRLLLALLIGVCPVASWGQSVQQSGSITPGHAVQWITNGVVGDAGTAAQGFLTSLGVTASGPSICANSGPVTGPYNQICLGANLGTGGAGINVNNFGGATGGFVLSYNGVTQGFSTVTLPTVGGQPACFSNTTGTLASCAGGTITGPGSSTNNAIAIWSGVGGTTLANSSGTITGTNLAGLTVNGNTFTTGTGTLTLGAGKTFTASNTLTLTGTDGTSFAFPSVGGTVATTGGTQTLTATTLTNVPAASFGTNGSTGGALVLNGSTSGNVTVGVLAAAGTTSFVLPNTNGSVGQLLQTDGAGNTSWQTASGTGTVTSITGSSGISTGTGSSLTSSGTLYDIRPPGGRLTLVTGTPVMNSNQTAKGTVYYDCYGGNGTVPYYNGSGDLTDAVPACEVSDAMVSAASAGQIVSGQVYDIFWVHGGANRICVAMSGATGGGGGWANDTGGSNTARGTGYSQLDTTTRPYITNKNSITNCFNAASNYGPVSANQGTYLGTIYATANGQTGMAINVGASGGGAPVLGVYNAYNRVEISSLSTDTGAGYNIGNIGWRKLNNSASESIQFVDGLGQSTITASSTNLISATSGTSGGYFTGISLDWTSGTPAFTSTSFAVPTSPAQAFNMSNSGFFQPVVGLHTLNVMEATQTAATTFVYMATATWGAPSPQTNNLQIKLAM